ncbi:MAG TPA: translocation/assembly module TamB domain-containing protein [Gemmatimonadales bacterium]|nr:translocation/assembly module TamB domain-containing protein [Gemmatimonadales bacterium]
MTRRVARVLFVAVVGTVALVLGVLTATVLTPPGRGLLARSLSDVLDRTLRGRVEVGGISGSFLYDLTFENLVVRDTSGVLLADFPRLDVSFRLPNFLARRIVLSRVRAHRPTIQLIKHRNGRMNFEEVLRLGEGKGGGGPSPLIEFHDVSLTDGEVVVLLPWNPPDTARTEAERQASLGAERAKPGRVIEDSPEGYRRRITIGRLTTRMPLMRISTPDRRPLRFEVDTLAARVSDPAVTVTDLDGAVQIAGDSLVFSLARGAMPATEFSGGGSVAWPDGPLRYNFSLDVPRLSLADVRWVSPDFPDMTGRTLFAARTESPTRTAYVLRDLHLQGGGGRVDGELVALDDKRRGLGVRAMDLALTSLDLDAVRGFLDTLPFHGTLTGRLRADGFFDRMLVDLDWVFADARVPGGATTRLVAAGPVRLGGSAGLAFDSVRVHEADVDLRTVRRLAPAVTVGGRLGLAGLLTGTLRRATFDGRIRHQDGDRPASELAGAVTLDTRGDTLGLATDLVLDPLVFDGLRGSFPQLPTRGALRGSFVSRGTLARLEVRADLAGELGRIQANGVLSLRPDRFGAESLDVRFDRLDLAALAGRGPSTALAGRIQATGVIDSVAPPMGELVLRLGPGRIREARLDTLVTRLVAREGTITVDTVHLGWPGGLAVGAGTLGWRRPRDGTLALRFGFETLTPFDSLVHALTGVAHDTTPESRPLDGTGRGTLALSGALDSLDVRLDAELSDLQWDRYRAPRLSASLTWLGGDRPRAVGSLAADSVTAGDRGFRAVRLDLAGWVDSLAWSGGAGFGSISRLAGGGRYWRHRDRGVQVLSVDTLTADLPGHRWRLARPFDVTLSDSVLELTPVELGAEDGSGVLRAAGAVPRASAGDLAIEALGLDLRDVYGLLQRDTTGVAGSIGVQLAVGGTAASPTIRGAASLADARFGDFNAPFLQAVLDYADRRLEANLVLWRTGQDVLRVEAFLPLDLALRAVPRRQVEGPLLVRVRADSVDLALLEAFTPDIRRVTGQLAADIQIRGTWEAPQLAGRIEIDDGAATLTGLGVRYANVNGVMRLSGDSIAIEHLRLSSGRGRLEVSGLVRLERLTQPRFDLDLRAQRFRAIDARNFLTLEATGDLRLTGPPLQPLLEGRVVANSGVLYFADLLNKRVLDLEDPAFADLVDTTSIRRQNLGAAFQSRFLDSLRIDNLSLAVGEDFWLRSSEANIKLDGSLRVDKVGRNYLLEGQLQATRGTYTLRIGPVTRDFEVRRGTVRYFGTPDLDAALDIEARHVVQPVGGGEEIPITARIEGTLQVPRLRLESEPGTYLSEYELVSYLMFGKPSFSLSGAGTGAGLAESQAFQTGFALLASALSTEVERTLISDIGVPIDFLEIRPGEFGLGGITGQTGATRVAAGWQIGRKVFLTVNASVCEDIGQLSYRNVGAGVEVRFSREWRLQSGFEPTNICYAILPPQALNSRYQLTTDILWEREY